MHEIINYLNQVDTSVFLYLNGFHNQYWDYFMTMYSSRFVWVPFYASFLYVMIRNLHIKVTIASLLVIVAIIFICDQTASTIIKPMVERMRPSNGYTWRSTIEVEDMAFPPLMPPTHGAWHSSQCISSKGTSSRCFSSHGHC